VTSDRKTISAQQAINLVTCHLSLATSLLLAGCNQSGDAAAGAAPPDAAAHSRNFTSVEYYPAPNQTQMKSRLTGTDAQPLPDGLLLIKDLKLEAFGANGNTNLVAAAPECIYDQQHNTANSPGHLQLQSGDGRMRTEGDGFLWRQSDSFLTISNDVYSVIKTSVWKSNRP